MSNPRSGGVIGLAGGIRSRHAVPLFENTICRCVDGGRQLEAES
jgi:hypothetical protein